MAKKAQKDERPPPVSSEEWLECGAALLSLAEDAPAEDLWNEVRGGDRDRAVEAIMSSHAFARAAKAWVWWSRLVASMQLSSLKLCDAAEERQLTEHLLNHLVWLVAPKPDSIRVGDQSFDPYARSWTSEAKSPADFAAMWRRAVSPPARRQSSPPWSIPSPIAATGGERPDPRERIMADPPWLAGVALDMLCREFRVIGGSSVEAEFVRCPSTEWCQIALFDSLDDFVKACLKKMAWGRSWFNSEMLGDVEEISPYWSFWTSRKWVLAAAHMAHPLATAALPTAILSDLKDYLKRLSRDNNDHHAGRKEIALAPDELAVLIEERG